MVTFINKDHLLLASNGALLQSGEESGAYLIQTLLVFFLSYSVEHFGQDAHLLYILQSIQLLRSPYQE